MNPLGIYFGPRMVSIAESKNKALVNSINIPQSRILEQDLQEKVPEEIKISIIFKEALKRAHIDALDVSIVVSGRDLIIRTFDMPAIPQNELFNALTFEVRKYIPFRIEDLVYDFQVQFDRATKKNFILFAGIKKDILNKYLSILKQLGMKVNCIDYSGFSVLRLLSVAGITQKGVIALVNIDLVEEDEINFMVLQNGFPLFSRDIVLPSESTFENVKSGKFDTSLSMDKFKSELRVSLDFYNRKFPGKKIEKIYFICDKDLSEDLLAFSKEKGLAAQTADLKKYRQKSEVFSSSLLKAFGGSLTKSIRTNIKIDLLNTKFRKPGVMEKTSGVGLSLSFFPELKISPKVVIAGVLICIFVFAFGVIKRLPVQEELRKIKNERSKISVVNPDNVVKDLSDYNSKFKKTIETLKSLLKNRVFLTSVLDAIPRFVPEGVWLNNFNYRGESDNPEMTLRGVAYLNDADKEMQSVNAFFAGLQKNPDIAKYFGSMEITSLDHSVMQKATVTNFTFMLKKSKR